MTLALLDGDIYVYKAAAACEQATCWGDINKPYLWTYTVDIDEAWAVLDRSIQRTLNDVDADDFVIMISDHGNNFRKDVLPSYKSNRSGKKPMGILPLEERLKDMYGIVVYDRCEADDVLGIWQTERDDTIICSIDKDMKTIAGKNYNPDTEELVDVSESEAEWNFYYQVLVGDATDGYKGCPKVGPKTAEKILDKESDDLWPLVVAQFEKAGLTEDDAIVQARMARILTKDLYKEGEVILWDADKRELSTCNSNRV